ncbi:hypothetical protein BaRGS_00026162 [Batillaria attramentaria]|uniref:Uncharacterized protein n=1 Tax=Batillaria attramentaria TaxID=370345 RepID=A0ABD0K6H4_9CAEN
MRQPRVYEENSAYGHYKDKIAFSLLSSEVDREDYVSDICEAYLIPYSKNGIHRPTCIIFSPWPGHTRVNFNTLSGLLLVLRLLGPRNERLELPS